MRFSLVLTSLTVVLGITSALDEHHRKKPENCRSKRPSRATGRPRASKAPKPSATPTVPGGNSTAPGNSTNPPSSVAPMPTAAPVPLPPGAPGGGNATNPSTGNSTNPKNPPSPPKKSDAPLPLPSGAPGGGNETTPKNPPPSPPKKSDAPVPVPSGAPGGGNETTPKNPPPSPPKKSDAPVPMPPGAPGGGNETTQPGNATGPAAPKKSSAPMPMPPGAPGGGNATMPSTGNMTNPKNPPPPKKSDAPVPMPPGAPGGGNASTPAGNATGPAPPKKSDAPVPMPPGAPGGGNASTPAGNATAPKHSAAPKEPAIPAPIPVPIESPASPAGNSSSRGNATGSAPSHPPESGKPPGRSPGQSRSNTQHRNLLYVTNWSIYGAGYDPDNIPIDTVTHVLYAFADIKANGTVISSDPWADTGKPFPKDNPKEPGNNAYGLVKQLYMKKMANRYLKTVLSVGGYSWSPKFVPVAADQELRANFVKSTVKLVADQGWDGVDIDWEYPNTTESNANCVKLLAELRTGLDEYSAKHAQGYHFTLGFPAPAGPQNYAAFDFKAMDKSLDYWSLMAFDFAGAWENTTAHQSNVYVSKKNPSSTKASIEKAVNDYTRAGIPPNKINLGMPLYGRAFSNTKGMGKPYSGLPNGTLEPGIWLYKDLPRPGARVHWDGVVKATYSYDNSTQQVVTYDDLKSALFKQGYINERNLGGAMYWEAAGDKTGDQSIVRNMAMWMGKLEKSMNLLSYPVSQYDNIRTNMGTNIANSSTSSGPK
ncbi:Endochitinase 1 [Colletotrichum trifolii]|uniref:chitinase n=1 Tax=Colletotrichum trifolii TaxID=5466 RepID=A0A4R8RBZ9_COLTR|nr:Endochitinase 1 [Colletotrichum trifolii]